MTLAVIIFMLLVQWLVVLMSSWAFGTFNSSSLRTGPIVIWRPLNSGNSGFGSELSWKRSITQLRPVATTALDYGHRWPHVLRKTPSSFEAV